MSRVWRAAHVEYDVTMFDLDPNWQIQKGASKTTVTVRIGPAEAVITFPRILNQKAANGLRFLESVATDLTDGYEEVAEAAADMAEVLEK